MIDYSPSVKYQYEKVNPLDPTEVWQDGKYHDDVLDCKVPVEPNQYDEIYNLLDGVGELLILFNHGTDAAGKPRTRAFVISKIDNMPTCPDDLHEYPEFTEFSLRSIYEELPVYTGDDSLIIEPVLVV
jgi:hypothetical protein